MNNPLETITQIFKKSGEQLQNEIGIDSKYDNVMIQRIVGLPSFVYIIIYDSRFPSTSMTTGKIRKAKSLKIQTAKKSLFGIELKNVKRTPAVNIKYVTPVITPQTLFIVWDMAGEYIRDKSVMKENVILLKNL